MSRSIVFIHGMFVTPRCWDPWLARFKEAGYDCSAPAWPEHDAPPKELRARHPDAALGKLSITDIVERYAKIIEASGERPILIGHSMGGLIVQLLLQRGLGCAGIAIDSAPPKGVGSLAWSFIRSNWAVISPFVKKEEPFLMSPAQFAYAFVHTLDAAKQRAIYEEHVVPESRVVGRGTLTDAARIDFAKPHPPLLFIAGERDRIIPASLNRTNFEKYEHAGSITELREFPGRTHYIIGQEGWTEVADYVEAWIRRVESAKAAPSPSGAGASAKRKGRGRRRVLIAGLALVALLVAAFIGIRFARHGASEPVAVRPNLVHQRNFITDFYLVRAGERLLAFDAGVDPEGRALDRALSSLGARREDVTDVYLTHGHFDHVGAAARCPRARIHVGREDMELLAQREKPGRFMVRVLQFLMPVDPVTATDPVSGLGTDDAGVLTIPAPGHTPGSYFYYVGGVLFTGDSMQIDADRLVPADPTFTLDLEENRRSIAALASALAGRPLDFVCTGHAGCTPPGRAREMLDRIAGKGTVARDGP